VYPATVAAGNRRHTCPTAGGQYDSVGGHGSPVAQLDSAKTGAQGGCAALSDQAHLLVVVPLRRLQGDVFDLGVAGEIVLRQRWSVVGEWAGVDQCQVALESTGSQRSDGADTADATSDDDDAGSHHDFCRGKR